MSRFIKAVDAAEVISSELGIHIGDLVDVFAKIPTADVVEIRHGRWLPSPDGINPIRCSKCNMPALFIAGENEFGDFEICRYPSSYCPECGAKMDGERSNE